VSLDYSELLLAVVKNKASDLHVTAGSPPMLRLRGSLVAIDGLPALTPTDTREFIYAILNSSQRQRLETDWQLDFAYAIPGVGRFRVNTYFQRGTIGATQRLAKIIGRGLAKVQRNPPEGLLGHENFLWSLTHVGIRQYWRDLESLETFTRSAPHAGWWKSFLADNGGAGFWHEAYSRRGIEAVYLDMPPAGLARFAPERAPVGSFMSTRERIDRDREAMAG